MKAFNSSVEVLCAPSISSALNEAVGLVVRRIAFIETPYKIETRQALLTRFVCYPTPLLVHVHRDLCHISLSLTLPTESTPHDIHL